MLNGCKFGLVLLLASFLSPCGEAAQEVIVKVTRLLAEYYAVDCVQIFRTDELSFRERERVYDTWKGLTTEGAEVTAGIYTFDSYATRKRKRPLKVSCYRSLKLLSLDEDSSRRYAEFTREFAIKDAVWLLFSKNLSIGFFQYAQIHFDDVIIIGVLHSEDLVSLHEVYRVGPEFPFKVLPLGNWTRTNGLSLPQNSFYDRRSDLEGISLKTVSLESWPATYWKDGKWNGFLIKIWDEIKNLINCTSISVRTRSNEIGIRLENGSWNGMVDMVLKGDVDIILSEIVIDKERSRVLKFLYPIMKTRFQIYTRHLGYDWQWMAILRPFHRSVWLAALAWILAGTVFVCAVRRLSMHYGLESGDSGKLFPAVDSFFFVVQAMCQQGSHATPKSYACRVLFFVSFAVSGVLIPSYSASLVSYLTQKATYKSFNSFNEMVEDGSYRLLLKENSAQHAFLAHAKDAFLKRAYEKLAKDVPEEQKKLGLRKSLSALCHLPRYAVMGIEEIVGVRMARMEKQDCAIVPLKNPMNTIHLTMATSKNNPFWGVINHHLKKLIINGIVARFKSLEFPPSGSRHKERQKEVGLRQLISAFVFIAACVLASAVILCLEIRHRACIVAKNKVKRKRRIAFQEQNQRRIELEMLKKIRALEFGY